LQASFHQTLEPKARRLGGQRAGTMRQTALDPAHARSTINARPTVDRFRKSRNFTLWLLISVNVSGLALFLYFASWVWAPRGQEGSYYEAGDSISWMLLAFPFLAICTLINLVTSRSVFVHLFLYRDWRLFSLWLAIVLVWFGAFNYDSGRHFDGSRMSNQDSGIQ
jgi:hypothetical protein